MLTNTWKYFDYVAISELFERNECDEMRNHEGPAQAAERRAGFKGRMTRDT